MSARIRAPKQTPQQSAAADERRRDIGFLFGMIGMGALAFSIGRNTAPGAGCQQQLLLRDSELILCESRLGGQPLA